MLICQSVLGALCTLKHTDLELYLAATSSFDMTGYLRVCSYERDLIYYHSGKRVCSKIRVTRVRIKGNLSRHTHAILPDILVPYSSYSIRFILSVICLYHNRNCSSSTFTSGLYLSRSTINTWIRLYEDHFSELLAILKDADQKLCDAESATTSIPYFPNMFLRKTGHPFLMATHEKSIVITPPGTIT